MNAGVTPAIITRDVARRFGPAWALRGVTLTVMPGEVVGLLGANGAGKSTLLRILATLLRPHAGVAYVCGHDVVRAPHEVRAHVAYVAHTPGLYDDLTARENLTFAAAMLDRQPGEVDHALERVGLAGAATRQVRGMSAGMQRRLALARLILARPRLLLLDEPYGNLDSAGVELLNGLITEWMVAGSAALMVLHELAPAAGVLHRVVTLQQGRLASMPVVSRAPVEPMSFATSSR